MEILLGDGDLLTGCPFAEGPVGNAVRMLDADKVVCRGFGSAETDPKRSGSHHFRDGLRFHKGISVVAAEGTQTDGGSLGGNNSHAQRLRDLAFERKGSLSRSIAAAFTDNDGQITVGFIPNRGQSNINRTALLKQAGGSGVSISGCLAGHGLKVGTAGVRNLYLNLIIDTFDPTSVGGVDFISALQRKGVLALLNGKHQTSVAVIVAVIAFHPVIAGGQLGLILQIIAVGRRGLAGQQVGASLDTVGIGIDLQITQLCAVQALEGNIGIDSGVGLAAFCLHCNGIGLTGNRFRAVAILTVIHTGPAGIAALDSDHRTVGHRNGSGALVLSLAHIGVYLIILIAGGRRDHHTVCVRRYRQRIAVGILIKSGGQCTGAEGQFFDSFVFTIKITSDIETHVHCIHHADLIAGA